MGDLPTLYSLPSRPFEVSGVDYAGPIECLAKCRGNVTHKGYIAMLVCFSTHAAPLEAVEDYSSSVFLYSFHRIMARHRHCADLNSDQGTTFVGADTELTTLFKAVQEISSQVLCDLAADGTRWHFISPGAQHFDGLWEATVKSVKHHLVRVIGDQILTLVELSSLLARIEAILNSCPLVALTPVHFLIGRSFFLVPEPDYTQEKIPLG